MHLFPAALKLVTHQRMDLFHAGLNQRLGLSNELFVLGDSLVLTVLGQVSFMPILVLAARLCPEVRSEASSL